MLSFFDRPRLLLLLGVKISEPGPAWRGTVRRDPERCRDLLCSEGGDKLSWRGGGWA